MTHFGKSWQYGLFAMLFFMEMLLVFKTEAHISDKQVQKSYNKTESNIRNHCFVLFKFNIQVSVYLTNSNVPYMLISNKS